MKTQKRLAASVLKSGVNRIRVNLEDEEVAMAITREDVRSAIGRNAIYKLPIKGTSKVRARKRKKAKAKGRHSGHGKRKGHKSARTPKKRTWITRIRAIRRRLRELKANNEIDTATYHKYYRYANAGMFKSKAQIESAIRKEK